MGITLTQCVCVTDPSVVLSCPVLLSSGLEQTSCTAADGGSYLMSPSEPPENAEVVKSGVSLALTQGPHLFMDTHSTHPPITWSLIFRLEKSGVSLSFRQGPHIIIFQLFLLSVVEQKPHVAILCQLEHSSKNTEISKALYIIKVWVWYSMSTNLTRPKWYTALLLSTYTVQLMLSLRLIIAIFSPILRKCALILLLNFCS